MTTKPPYRVPSMSEIRALPKSGLRMVSTFSGSGASCLGFKMAGTDVLWASEFIPAAQETYRANHPGTVLDTRDIRLVKPEEILDQFGLKPGELDIFEGSPPCKSFSTSGKREKGWGDVALYSDGVYQRTDDLFFEYIRILKGLQPKVFVAENVTGLVKGVSRGMFLIFLEEMRQLGYRVKAAQLNASWLGVPQARERIIYLGVRNDLEVEPSFPKPFPYQYTVRDAFEGLDPNAAPKELTLEEDARLYKFWCRTPPGETFAYACAQLKGKDSYFDYRRLAWTRPAPTVRASTPSLYHPDLPRTLTVPELRRITGFPDDYELVGTYEQQWERCGRCVPPGMYAALGAHIRDVILPAAKATT